MIKVKKLLKAIGFASAFFVATALMIAVGILFNAYIENGKWWFLGLVGFVCSVMFIYKLSDVD